MPVTRDSPSIQGDVLAQTPPGLPLTRRLPGGARLSGQPAGVSLPAKVRQAERRCPHERDVPGPRLGHAIGTERFPAVTSGVAGRHAQAVAGEALAQRRPGGVQLGRGGVDAAQLLGELEGAFGLGPVGQEAAGLPAQVALSGRADQVARLVLRPIPRGARFGERALPHASGSTPTQDGSTVASVASPSSTMRIRVGCW
jgi:hypothetical protein